MSKEPAKTVAIGADSCAKLLAKAAKNNADANKVILMLMVFFMFKKLIINNRFEIEFICDLYLKIGIKNPVPSFS